MNIPPKKQQAYRHVINVKVASGMKSTIKPDATRMACMRVGLNANVEVRDARSDIDAQPEGREMGMRGARNRALALRMLFPDDYVVGMEDFLEYDQGPQNTTAIVVMRPDGFSHETFSKSIPFDERDVEEARKRGFREVTVGDVVAERCGSDPANPHGPMTNYSRDRTTVMANGLIGIFETIKRDLDNRLLNLTDTDREETFEVMAGKYRMVLPVRTVNQGTLRLAFFNCAGTPASFCGAEEKLAHEFAPRLPDNIAVVVTPKGKGVTMAKALARALDVPCVTFEKGEREVNPFAASVPYSSRTTEGGQLIGVDASGARLLQKVSQGTGLILVFDDVISTGGTSHACERLALKFLPLKRIVHGLIFTEGDEWTEKISPERVYKLGHLPCPVPPQVTT